MASRQPLLGGSKVYDAPGLDAEEAETANFASIEKQRRPPTQQQQDSYQRMLATMDEDDKPKNPALRFRNAAKRIQGINALKKVGRGAHRKTPSHAHNLLESIQIDKDETSGLIREASGSDSRAFLNTMTGFDHDSSTDEEEDADAPPGQLPLRTSDVTSSYGSINTASISTREHKWRRFFRRCCDGPRLQALLLHLILRSPFVWLGIPLSLAAWVLFYWLGNPKLDFLPGEATLSWWCNFAVRQLVTLELARLSMWLLVDVLVLGTRITVKLLGPLLTLFFIQAKGWPFVVTIWSLWDLCILHGDNDFQVHWFYWTGLKIYNLEDAASGSYIINSGIYLRILLAAVIAGSASAVKRLCLTIVFSKRQCTDFKPRLEKILAEMVLVTEVAALAANSDALSALSEQDELVLPANLDQKKKGVARVGGVGDVHWKSIKFHEVQADEEDEVHYPKLRDTSGSRQYLSMNSSGHFKVRDLLDRWDEPVNKGDKTEVSISDVLKFKRALAYMDDKNPFGDDFGPASNRDDVIASSDAVYRNLLKINQGSNLNFDVLALIATDDDGAVDQAKRSAIRRLFRPDASDELTHLAFIQSCDSVYKRLRYFRASVDNASVIDNVLEGIVNGFFYFVLALILLSLLQFNPWTLLVSITSLLVSVSFALGPSVSKYVEGVLLIAVRRPYDLGDRIFMGGAETPSVAEISGNTAFVEDINLTTTTLRFARTNEVSTVNNWAIAASRIVNCNRSPNAIIVIEQKFHLSLVTPEKLEPFVDALKRYVYDHPRIWDSMAFCRHDMIDSDMEQVQFTIAFRHRSSWQDTARIKLNRADLILFIHNLGDSLGVNNDSPPVRRLLYYGGVLQNGQVEDYKKNLLRPKNIRSHSQSFNSAMFERGFAEDLTGGMRLTRTSTEDMQPPMEGE